ncbi:MAG: hypothetical protein BWY43_00778 [candidate division WS2 bacterium ADurb.Bin280]|uniref:Uncharacterized protein n=1 Tax=candidate division WS2 bacterium ADurb.Bin280 TaxID=1852829 RepID=A0A1V5SCE2_9BACT|nr:MAG: hypothetical protein BWY43_00778 [candidate division WS2 bacterium ADurb.Bin280]
MSKKQRPKTAKQIQEYYELKDYPPFYVKCIVFEHLMLKFFYILCYLAIAISIFISVFFESVLPPLPEIFFVITLALMPLCFLAREISHRYSIYRFGKIVATHPDIIDAVYFYIEEQENNISKKRRKKNGK